MEGCTRCECECNAERHIPQESDAYVDHSAKLRCSNALQHRLLKPLGPWGSNVAWMQHIVSKGRCPHGFEVPRAVGQRNGDKKRWDDEHQGFAKVEVGVHEKARVCHIMKCYDVAGPVLSEDGLKTCITPGKHRRVRVQSGHAQIACPTSSNQRCNLPTRRRGCGASPANSGRTAMESQEIAGRHKEKAPPEAFVMHRGIILP
mmetsp:Transcript_49165/g.107386  ORF Transcript_49165/g.107386 Transcript_49165/m.107386 type:complete len:203 (-) Transcript_49165:182-790(-)